MKIRQVGAEWFQADGRKDELKIRQTHMMKLMVAFRCFANAPGNKQIWQSNNLWINMQRRA
jgi:hypothetical protein